MSRPFTFAVGCLLCSCLISMTWCQDATTTATVATTEVENATTSRPPTTQPPPEPTTITVTTADVCNLSLITSDEGTPTTKKKCTCSGVVGDVDCSHLGITDLPLLISFPKEAKVANFEGNLIANLQKDTFYSGKGITELDFSYNKIDFVSVSAFGAFKNLRKLDLSHNRLWNLPGNVFQGLSSLRRLDLSFNDLINVFPELFSPLPELRELVLKSNPLEELSPKHFEPLEHLETLDLESTLLKVIPDMVFVFTPRLKVLNLASNRLSEVPSEALKELDHLKVLDLSGNPIEVVEKEAFRSMIALTILYLNRMPELTKIERYAFGNLINLQELHCSYNFLLSSIDPLAFVRRFDNKKVPLSQLFLRQGQLSSVPQDLLDWSELVELHLGDNPLHCDCSAQWLVNAKLKNNFQAHVKCATPSEYEGLTLTALKDEDLTCGLHLSEIALLACAIVAGLLVLALIVAFLLWRRHYAGYSRPRYVQGRKYINDIVYAGGDDVIFDLSKKPGTKA